MKICPHCGYEKNSDSALSCGLCGSVFGDAQEKVQGKPLSRYRKDFAQEIRDNRWNSIALIVGFPILILMLGLAFDLWFGTAPWGVIGAICISMLLAFEAWYDGDKTILDVSAARLASPDTDQQLINIVDEMRIAAGLPMPRVYVIDSPSANAFATGRDPEHASVAVTRGLMETLNREEIQGVIGHEMSHVRNLDIRYMMLVSAMLGAVVLLSEGFRRGAWWGGGFRRRDSRSSGSGILAVVALLFAILAPLIAIMLQAAVSRKREFLADASSVELTRNPLALASALDKIETRAYTEPLASASRATQHLYIINPLRSITMSASSLLSTHPPTEARIRVLRAMSV
jgi:heat shock protein HtpX